MPPDVLPILTPRLRLRALRADDLDALTGVYTHPLVARWIGAHTREDVAREIGLHVAHQSATGWSFWAVEDRESGRLLGDCGLQPLEQRGPEVELGYDLHPDAWGRGLATEAARAVMAAAFGPLRLDRVVAVVKPDHVASQRVLEKAGLERAGVRAAYGEELVLYEARGAVTADRRRRVGDGSPGTASAMTEPRAIDFSTIEPAVHDQGVHDHEAEVASTRWALVEYAPGAGRDAWCDTPHSGFVAAGALVYEFEDGREPLRIGPGEAFALPAAPRHRGRNEGTEPTRLFVIDALVGG
ncbi:MAG TPA: GNAT family N-acetyltransferase [Baekduia sp.]|nr:GNAT family N-acetyltransferase [Baekduia sp.]